LSATVATVEAPILETAFFARSVHDVARDLIGCTLTYGDAGGVIVETESYARDDPACHAYNGPTPRSSILFGPPGRAYVYLSYGIHSLLNAVAEADGEPGAVLIRALEPTIGVPAMMRRRRQTDPRRLCSGPGKLTEALGIDLTLNAAPLTRPPFDLRGPTDDWRGVGVATGPRVGITRATELPWRFSAADSPFVSRPLP
jgi:DNA-3-methyladenine glycosylase